MSDETDISIMTQMSLQEARTNLDKLTEMFDEANSVGHPVFDECETREYLDEAIEIQGIANDLVKAIREQKELWRMKNRH